MTYAEFRQYDPNTQIDLALDEGVIIGKRLAYDDLLVLYHLHAFYVEISYMEDLSQIYAVRHGYSDELREVRLLLHQLVAVALTSNNEIFKKAKSRSKVVTLAQDIEKVVEAIHLLYDGK